jgi:hypothetical protein
MNKAILLLLFVACSIQMVFAQTYPEDFIIPLSGKKVSSSLYKKIDFLDSRPTERMLNRKPKTVTSLPLPYQLTNLMDSITDTTAKEGELLLQLRLFNFAEITGNMSQKGNCYLRAVLYVKKDNRYQKINSLDTSVAIQVSPNLSKLALQNAGKVLAAFVSDNLLQIPVDSTSYSLNDIKGIEDIEKRSIKFYATSIYTDGIYLSYNSLKDQLPDIEITDASMTATGNLFGVRTKKNEEKVKIKPRDIYAVVYKGIPYKATKYGLYEMKKINGNFFFTGNIEIKSDVGDAATNGAAFGLLGVVSSLGEEETYDMTLDYVNGQLIRIKKIESDIP